MSSPFLLTDLATPDIYTLSLHDALPILWAKVQGPSPSNPLGDSSSDPNFVAPGAVAWLKLTVAGAEEGPTGGDTLTRTTFIQRSEEHTSELQSHSDLVCRLLLEKKKRDE